MLVTAFVACVIAISATNAFETEDYFTRKDFKNWHDIFMWTGNEKWTTDKRWALNKMCDMVRNQQYRNPLELTTELGLEDSLDIFDFKTKRFGRKHLREVEHCCNKISTTEKKICLKEMRENFLDQMCDQGVDHVCCKNEFQTRYSCFGKNVNRAQFPRAVYDDREQIVALEQPYRRRRSGLTSWDIDSEIEERVRDVAEPQFSYLERLDDMRGLKSELIAEKYNTERVYGEDLDFERTRRFRDFGLGLENELGYENMEDRMDIVDQRMRTRRCPESSRCMNEVEAMTDVAAQRVCTENLVKSGRRETESCCRAGALVGKTVGRKHRQVCVPAVFNLHRKVQNCVMDKQQCKEAFVQCCHERAERARDERVLEKDLTREIVREELEEPMMFERRTMF